MTFKEKIYHRHDVYCNQKYGSNDEHLYSFHLACTLVQGRKFFHLLSNELISNPKNAKAKDVPIKTIVEYALDSHDSLEGDARMTYNDLIAMAEDHLENYVAAIMLADIVYGVTDEKGKNRAQRKNQKYYDEMKQSPHAMLIVFVKLADRAANILYSKLTGSSMYVKYKSEWADFKEKTYLPELGEFFDYVESL